MIVSAICSYRPNAALFALALTLLGESAHAQFQCEALFVSPAALATDVLRETDKHSGPGLFNDVPTDLNSLQFNETYNRTTSQIRAMNLFTYREFAKFAPASKSGGNSTVPLALARTALRYTFKHPVFGKDDPAGYNRPPPNDIGYCFGRAMFVHELLLKMGVENNSIRKIWAVGELAEVGKPYAWQFHVATIAYTKELGWVVFDSYSTEPQPLADWIQMQMNSNHNGQMRIYITSANKFAWTAGAYDPFQMGLKSPIESDWYRHYFVHMNYALSTIQPAELGLKAFPPPPAGQFGQPRK